MLLIVVGAPLCTADAASAQSAPSALVMGSSAIGVASAGGGPLISISLPGLSGSSGTSSTGLSLPSIGVTVPSVGVTVPSVGVSLPGVSVTTPEVNVSTPGVTVSTPEVGVTTPSLPAKAPTEGSAPASPEGGQGEGRGSTGGGGASGGGGSTGGGGTSGGGAGGGGPPSSGGNGSDIATAAAVSGPTKGASSAAPAPAARSHAATDNGGSLSPRNGRHSTHASARAHDRTSGVASIATAASTPGAAGLRSHMTARASHVAGGQASNPLDTIGRQIPLPLPVPDWSKPIIMLLLLLAIGFAVRSLILGRRARGLEGQRATLLRDVDAMQAALVPEVPARVGGLAVSVAYRPADGPAAGGDFYDIFAPERGKIAIILGDVVGHGHRALTHAALTRYTLRAYLQAGMQPRAALALAGQVLADRTMENFATVAVGVYDARAGSLTYASAGHPVPILHGLQTRAPLAICASPPIGWTVPTGRRQTTVSLPPGAVACFFTDGLVEARCKENELLGRERLSEILAALGSRPDAAKLLAKVRATALFTPDDMAACIVVPEMTVIPTRTHIEELEADAQELDRGDVRRFLETCQVPSPGVEQAVAQVCAIAAVYGTAVLRAELAPNTATVTVSTPRATAEVKNAQHGPKALRGPSSGRRG
jgi:hypothetical protein